MNLLIKTRVGKYSLASWLFVLFLLPSCNVDEGEGGTASISGTIQHLYYSDDFSLLIHSQSAPDEEVLIVYGEDEGAGDRVRTDAYGQFSFRYLYPGSYTLYFESEDPEATLNVDQYKIVKVELAKGEDLDLGNLEKLSTLDYDDGSAIIRGTVIEIEYVTGTTIEARRYPATEQEVYLTYGDHEFYDDRIRTQDDGSFSFTGLIPGDYKVFLYSDDSSGDAPKVGLIFEASIEENDEIEDLGEIEIIKMD